MNENELQSIIKSAISNDNGQISIANMIPKILELKSAVWIKNDFIPFLTSWFQPFDEKSVPALIVQIPEIIKATGSIMFISELIGKLLLSDNKQNRKLLAETICKCIDNDSKILFIDYLLKSRYDSVRSFVPKVFSICENEDNKIFILSALAYDDSFKVRLETVKLIKKLDDEISLKLTLLMIDDASPKIRSMIIKKTITKPYFYNNVAQKLYNDLDWKVRASFASLLSKSSYDCGINHIVNLLKDSVAYVRINALKSMSILMQSDMNSSIQVDWELVLNTVMYFSKYENLKYEKIACEMMFLLFKRKDIHMYDSYLKLYINELLSRQNDELILFFISLIVKYKFAYLFNAFKPKLIDFLQILSKNKNSLIRYKIVNLFNDISVFAQDPEIDNEIINICYDLLSDDDKQIRYLVLKILMGYANDNTSILPSFYSRFAQNEDHVERKKALYIIQYIIKSNQHADDINILMNEVKLFLSDKDPSIVKMAKIIIKETENFVNNKKNF